MVFDPGGRLLLVRRGKPPRLGEWSLPGGAVEPGETDETALRREILEECHIQVKMEFFIAESRLEEDEGCGGRFFRYRIKTYCCSSPYQEAQAGSDAESVLWADAASLESLGLAREFLVLSQKALRMRQRNRVASPRGRI